MCGRVGGLLANDVNFEIWENCDDGDFGILLEEDEWVADREGDGGVREEERV